MESHRVKPVPEARDRVESLEDGGGGMARCLIVDWRRASWSFGFARSGRVRLRRGTVEDGHACRDPMMPRVEVVAPGTGGIERVTVQPGSVHAFESVDLYAMVSGYLKTQDVDIGSRVKKGQVLAELDVPREENAVSEAAAMLDQAKAHARQAEAKVKAMEAERETAAATVAQTEADVDRLVANRKLAETQYLRVKSLYERNAVDKKLVDEQQRDLEAAVAAERTSHLAVHDGQGPAGGAQPRRSSRRGPTSPRRRSAVECRRGPPGQGPGRPGLRQDRRARSTASSPSETSIPGPSSDRPRTAASSPC